MIPIYSFLIIQPTYFYSSLLLHKGLTAGPKANTLSAPLPLIQKIPECPDLTLLIDDIDLEIILSHHSIVAELLPS